MRFVVSGRSMEPNFHNGDKLFVSTIFHKFIKPHRGDSVVVKDPRDGRLVLKRIESVENDKYLVRGDSSASSTDSRTFGSIPQSAIVGKVIFRYLGKKANSNE